MFTGKSYDPDSFGFVVYDISRLFTLERERKIISAGLDLTPCEARTLVHVARYQPARQSVLAENMNIEAMTLSGYLDRLENRNLLRREADPDDRRAKLIFLNDAAVPVLDALKDISKQTIAEAAQALPPEEWQGFLKNLLTVRAHLRQINQQNRKS
ncbi:MarR family winged helix-turn-helix transcriptional regulator [Pseudochrobactrum sp. HB0163]|uniref:MarR family winged helix-turn-helix transcriptional regulator n=1 Tax=Pseudochrobactrum sp. HB0163 TaxID=3450708 RepID=UPI003F6DE261